MPSRSESCFLCLNLVAIILEGIFLLTVFLMCTKVYISPDNVTFVQYVSFNFLFVFVQDNLLLDMYLAPHVNTLYTQIRNRALCQVSSCTYFVIIQPFKLPRHF